MTRGARGSGSLAAIVVGMLLIFVLIVLYLRAFTPSGPKGGPAGSALEAARKQAQNFEEEQRKRLEAMRHAAE